MGAREWICMIMAILEINLKFPYKISMGTLVEFCSLWESSIFSGSTRKRKSVIAIPAIHFKTIFGKNPSVGKLDIPSGTENFIESLKVKEVIVR